jgi:lysophospholipase L1-like esterase
MYIFFIICIIIILFIIYNNFILVVENFFSKNKTVILIGDSILQNKNYADPSIEDYLSEKIPEDQLFCFAEDNSTISITRNQINQIPDNLNNSYTYIFVSVGGNDILNNKDVLFDIMTEYENLINDLHEKMNNCHIILLNLYYPTTSFFKIYYKYIDTWNIFIKKFSNKHMYKLLDLTKIINEPNDITHFIEPSVFGGKKITNKIETFL